GVLVKGRRRYPGCADRSADRKLRPESGLHRQAHDLARLRGRGRLVTHLANDAHEALGQLLVGRQFALLVIDVVLQARSRMAAEQDRLDRCRKLRWADAADAE